MAHSRLYAKIMASQEWQTLRQKWLEDHPYCERCKAVGLTRKADVVHHVKPIESAHTENGYMELAFNEDNLLSVCNYHHALIHRKELKSWTKQGQRMRANDRLQVWINKISGDMIDQ